MRESSQFAIQFLSKAHMTGDLILLTPSLKVGVAFDLKQTLWLHHLSPSVKVETGVKLSQDLLFPIISTLSRPINYPSFDTGAHDRGITCLIAFWNRN